MTCPLPYFCGSRIGGLRIGACELAISRLRTPSTLAFVGGLGISARSGAESASRELRAAMPR
eukprot:10382142-Alexandrium_andersonii.AAC.1